MNLLQTKSIIVAFIFLMGATNLFAQEKGDDRTDTKTENHWFWDWLFNDMDDKVWDNPTNSDIYDAVELKINLTNQWKFSIGDNQNWKSSTYNDQKWESIKVPSDWENDGFNGYDGFAWYRFHFDGSALKNNQVHFLILGFIDDVDETYLNGKLVGKTGSMPPRFRTAYNSNRKYHIPNDIINFEGDNLIAVRVYDDQLSGGIISGKPGIYVSESSQDLVQDLYGPWKFKNTNNSKYKEVEYDDDHWDNMLVPSYWDNQGYRSFDGTAWYRKHFELSFIPEKGTTYYMVVGVIDDFDKTYLNGIKIGETDDGEDYGVSKSYQQLRIYKIPEGLLNKFGNNILSVKVHDFGGEGGIYRGPVGIVEEQNITKLLRNIN